MILLIESGALVFLVTHVVKALAAAEDATRKAAHALDARLEAEAERGKLDAKVSTTREEVENRLIATFGHLVSSAKAGDFSVRAEGSAELGRLGVLVEGLNEVNAAVDRATSDVLDVLNGIGDGDPTRRVEGVYSGRFAELKDATNHTVTRLSTTLATIQSTTVDVASAARQINAGADDMCRAAPRSRPPRWRRRRPPPNSWRPR